MVAPHVGHPEGSPKRVLVCDDESHILRLIQLNLERQGHQITCVMDGAEAIAVLDSALLGCIGSFDRIVLDARMSKVSSYDVLEWIRTHEETRNAWVAIMISDHMDRESWEGLPFRADLYIAKPFNPIELVS